MPEPEKNPHVDLNNAKEEARQEKRCTHHCIPPLAHPECQKHGLQKLGDWKRPVWDGPQPSRVEVTPSAISGILERLIESNATLKRLCHEYIKSLGKFSEKEWSNPHLIALAKFLDRK